MDDDIPTPKIVFEIYDKLISLLSQEWADFFKNNQLKSALVRSLESMVYALNRLGVEMKHITMESLDKFIIPSHDLIFAALSKFSPTEARVVILGQDPYPNRDDARGFSFHSPNPTQSMRCVYNALKHSKFIKVAPKTADLTNWINQGVLLLNVNLTRSPKIHRQGKGRYSTTQSSDKSLMHKGWLKFTTAFLNALATENPNIIIMHWGSVARSINIEAQCNHLYWGHPSPAWPVNLDNSDKRNFKYCDNFIEANYILYDCNYPEIDWSLGNNKNTSAAEIAPKNKLTSDDRVFIITDGGCVKNGKKTSFGAYCTYFPSDVAGIKNMIPEKTIAKKIKRGGTNIRAEMLAIIRGLEYVLYKNIKPGAIVIVTDSEFTINVVTKWMDKWYDQNPSFTHKKNPDLVERLYNAVNDIDMDVYHIHADKSKSARLKRYITKKPGLLFIHQKSHLKKSVRENITSRIKVEVINLNEYADNKCTELINAQRNFHD